MGSVTFIINVLSNLDGDFDHYYYAIVLDLILSYLVVIYVLWNEQYSVILIMVNTTV